MAVKMRLPNLKRAIHELMLAMRRDPNIDASLWDCRGDVYVFRVSEDQSLLEQITKHAAGAGITSTFQTFGEVCSFFATNEFDVSTEDGFTVFTRSFPSED